MVTTGQTGRGGCQTTDDSAVLPALLDAVAAGVGLLRQGRFYRVNACMVRMTGYPAAELLGRHWTMLCLDENGGIATLADASALGAAMRPVALRWRRADGEVIEVLVSSAPLSTSDRDPDVVLTVVADTNADRKPPVSSTGVAGRALPRQHFLRKERLSALGSMTASILHECNNPLCGVRSVIERLARTAGQAGEDRRMLDLAIAECDRMIEMLRAVRQFSEPTAEVVQRLNLDQLIDAVLLLSSKHLKRNKVALRREPARGSLFVRGFANQLKQAVLALINRCVEHAGQTGGEIRIRTHQQGSLGEMEIVVRPYDAGPTDSPVAPGDMEAAVGRESDIGLWIARDIVRAHDGKIGEKITSGRAMVLTVHLPVEDEEVCQQGGAHGAGIHSDCR